MSRLSLPVLLGLLFVACEGNDEWKKIGELYWSDISEKPRFWSSVNEHCKALGGRPPTISELRTLIVDCPTTETGGACGVKDDCLYSASCHSDACNGCGGIEGKSHSRLGDTETLWSSQLDKSDENGAWIVDYLGGYVNGDGIYNTNYIRCVK